MSDYIGISVIPFDDATTRKTQAFTGTSAGKAFERVAGGIKTQAIIAAPGAPSGALAGAGAGNVDNGAHKYLVTFVTSSGETVAGTASGSVTVSDKSTDGKVNLTAIPTGTLGVVKSRKVYRSKVGDLTTFYLLTTLNDNTTTTYQDNTADSGLGAQPPSSSTANDPYILRRPRKILVDTDQVVHLAFGVGSTPTATTGFQKIEIGERQIVDVPDSATHFAVIRNSANGTFGYSYLELNLDSV